MAAVSLDKVPSHDSPKLEPDVLVNNPDASSKEIGSVQLEKAETSKSYIMHGSRLVLLCMYVWHH